MNPILADEEHDRQNEKDTKKQKRLEKKRKEKEKKRAILDARKPENDNDSSEEPGGLLPETEDFLANLTVPDGDSDDGVDYDRSVCQSTTWM